jgi:hypothetical protein
MMEAFSAIWLSIVASVMVWAAVRYTDKEVWKGVLWGACIAFAGAATLLSLITLFGRAHP